MKRKIRPVVTVLAITVGILVAARPTSLRAADGDIAPESAGERAFLDRVHARLLEAPEGRDAPVLTEGMRVCIHEFLNSASSPWSPTPTQFVSLFKQAEAALQPRANALFRYVLAARRQQSQVSNWEKSTRAMLQSIVNDAEASGPYLTMLAASRWSNTLEEGTEARAIACGEALRAAEACFSAGIWKPEEVRLAFSDLANVFQNVEPTGDIEFFLRRLTGKIDPWLEDMLHGHFHVLRAWDERGGGWARDVPEEGWVGFEDHLRLATEHLLRAHGVAPNRPEAAALLITVAMGSSDEPGGLSENEWFERAMAADPAYRDAWVRQFTALLPRWGGSHREMLELGQRATSLGDHTTPVPYQLIVAIDRVASDITALAGDAARRGSERPPDVYAHLTDPALYRKAADVLEGYLSEPSLPKYMIPVLQSKLACYAWKHGDWNTAARVLTSLPIESFDISEAGRFLVHESVIYEDAFLNTSTVGAIVRRGDEALEAGRIEDAVAAYSSAVESADNEHVAAIARQRLASASIETSMQSDQWVDLKFVQGLDGWSVFQGAPEPLPDGDLSFPPSETHKAALIVSEFETGRRWEMTWSLTLDAESQKGSLVLFPSWQENSQGENAATPAVMFLAMTPQIQVVTWDDRVNKQQTLPVEAFSGAGRFRLVRWDSKVRLWVNDMLVLDQSLAEPFGDRIAMGRSQSLPNCETVLRDMRFRVLSAEPRN